MSPDAEALARLARKYRLLAALRRVKVDSGVVPDRAFFRALAETFPGALHELDTLPLDEIDRRAEALEAAASGGDRAPWMEWQHGYHALLRAALRIKARARKRELDDARVEALARDASQHAGVEVDAAFVRAVAAPVRGRIVGIVATSLAARTGRREDEVRAIVRGPRAKR